MSKIKTGQTLREADFISTRMLSSLTSIERTAKICTKQPTYRGHDKIGSIQASNREGHESYPQNIEQVLVGSNFEVSLFNLLNRFSAKVCFCSEHKVNFHTFIICFLIHPVPHNNF